VHGANRPEPAGQGHRARELRARNTATERRLNDATFDSHEFADIHYGDDRLEGPSSYTARRDRVTGFTDVVID
jgi:hypothetical protein